MISFTSPTDNIQRENPNKETRHLSSPPFTDTGSNISNHTQVSPGPLQL